MLNELTEYKRLGYYSVGDKILINKADALIEATSSKNNVHWNFNDEIFSFIDWTIPIDVSLNELYRQRAQQLRDKYDYLSLYYSGGVDSTNVLHAFIDNNILLDEIVMYRPKLLDTFTNRIDRSNNNVFSEIEFAAIPHLKKYIKDPRTNIRIINIDTSLDNFLKDDNLVSEFQTINLFMPTGAGRLSMNTNDFEWNRLYMLGKKVCHIHGIDKPVIKLVNGEYIFQFLDTMVTPAVNVPKYNSSFSEMFYKQQFHELFYWTPDLPQLVIKQCQVVKSINKTGDFTHLFEKSDRLKQDKFLFIHQYIYPSHVNSVRDLFVTEKPGADIYSGQGSWFHERMDNKSRGVFKDIITNMQNSIDTRFFRGYDNTNYYLEDPDVGSPKTALRAIKSRKYIL